jgi:hypothetical protein
MKLFTRETTAGIFRGFSEGGLEFHADLVLPYRNEFQSAPMHGQFLVVQLEDEDEAVLGRITSITSQGRLASPAGEDYGIRAVAEERPIPEDLREQYLKYRVNMRVLGVIRLVDGNVVFAASHRRLPHVGSKVAFLTDDLLCEVAGHNIPDAAELGYFTLGEFIYAGDDNRLRCEAWMQVKKPCVIPRFHVLDLVARRTLVFARAGFGKSNLVKLLFANLYKTTPTTPKRGGRQVPVGTVIFDPDGEYFWPDDKNRPGLCDVPELEDKIIVFTPKAGPSPFYQSFVAGDIRLDIRRLRPADVISIALSPEKQDQQNVRKLKGMNDAGWKQLVDLVHRDGNGADGPTIMHLLQLQPNQDAEMVAARANMATIVRMLHDPSSQMMDMLLAALRHGSLCIVDVSQMRGTPALVLSGLMLRRIFDHNQEEFTKADPQTIPVIAVVEEAQAVLGSGGSSGEGPYVTWVKEGRKYDLGAVLITQQPGAITGEILSQGDNWFAFHLLSAGDLRGVKSANAHFSDDILSSLLNEPIPGHGVFWSSVGGKSYPIPIRVLSFEGLYSARDPRYEKPPAKTAANALRERFTTALASARDAAKPSAVSLPPAKRRADVREPEETEPDEEQDALGTYEDAALEAFKADADFLERLKKFGLPWRGVLERLKQELPDVMSDRDRVAYDLVPMALNATFGEQHWKTEKRPSKSKAGGLTTWVVVTMASGNVSG